MSRPTSTQRELCCADFEVVNSGLLSKIAPPSCSYRAIFVRGNRNFVCHGQQRLGGVRDDGCSHLASSCVRLQEG